MQEEAQAEHGKTYAVEDEGDGAVRVDDGLVSAELGDLAYEGDMAAIEAVEVGGSGFSPSNWLPEVVSPTMEAIISTGRYSDQLGKPS